MPETRRSSTTAHDAALRLLAQREHSEVELARKLQRRGYDSADIESIMAELRQRGWLSNERFAEQLVRARKARGHGPVRIRADLRERGVPDSVADAYLADSAEHWLAQAQAAREKRFGAQPPADRRAWNRQARFLAGRGFPAALIYRVLGRD